MTYRELVKKSVSSQPVYEPGRPIEVVAKAFGLDPAKVLKLASNENPLGPSPKAMVAAQKALQSVALYPENNAFFLKEELAARLQLSPDQIIVGHGSNEIIGFLGQAFVERGTEVVMGEHAFISYKLTTLLHGGRVVEVPLVDFRHDLEAMARAITGKTRLVFLPSPNNPTGTSNTREQIFSFVQKLPEHVIFCFDGAYEEYLEEANDLRPLISAGKKVICLRTFSKIYGLAGLRIGYGYADPELIEILNQVRPPFNVNSVAQAAALSALHDHSFVEESRRMNKAGMQQLRKGFAGLGLDTVPSTGNFFLVKLGERASRAFNFLQKRGIIVRPLLGYALPDYLRITVGTAAQNQTLLAAFAAFLEEPVSA